jgi:hypothetical protein
LGRTRCRGRDGDGCNGNACVFVGEVGLGEDEGSAGRG